MSPAVTSEVRQPEAQQVEKPIQNKEPFSPRKRFGEITQKVTARLSTLFGQLGGMDQKIVSPEANEAVGLTEEWEKYQTTYAARVGISEPLVHAAQREQQPTIDEKGSVPSEASQKVEIQSEEGLISEKFETGDTGVEEKGIEQSTIKDYLTWRREQGKPNDVDLTPEGLHRSQQEYIEWRKSQYEGAMDAEVRNRSVLEPGRATVFCHATSIEGAQKILASEKLKSPRKAILDGTSMEHAPRNRNNVIPEDLREGISQDNLTAEMRQKIEGLTEPFIAGTLGKVILGYTPDRNNVHVQAAVVFPLDILRLNGFSYEKHFARSGSREQLQIPKEHIEDVQMRLKHLPTQAGIGSENSKNTLEINLASYDSEGERTPAEISINQGVVLLPESQVNVVKNQLREHMALQGKTEQEIAVAAKKIIGFSPDFGNVDVAIGWLTNTPEGQRVLAERSGVDISQQMVTSNTQSEDTYIDTFILEKRKEIEDILQSDKRLNANPDPTYHVTPETMEVHKRDNQYRGEIINHLKAKKYELHLAA